jgi:hypothetical protein
MRAQIVSSVLVALASSAVVVAAAPADPIPAPLSSQAVVVPAPSLYIVQGTTLDAAASNVRRVGANVRQELDIIHAVSAYLTPAQSERLRTAGLKVYADRTVTTRGLFDFLKQTFIDTIS